MSQSSYDAIVIGGGPGGSTAAAFLARAGKRVLLLEKERFPRFHIGESLLPYNRRLFQEMGVLPALEAAGFLVKVGAQFHLGDASKCLKLVFRRGCFTKETTAFQVERSKFDHLLLNHARASGAEVQEGQTVTGFSNEGESVTVRLRAGNGELVTSRGTFLVDASGRGNLTGNLQLLRVIHPKLKKLALFGQFEGVLVDEGQAATDTVIVRLENKWFWIIPLTSTKISVGCVMDQEEFAKAKETPEVMFARLWQSNLAMRERMKNARSLSPIQATSDFSYFNRRLVDRRLLRVGDAAGFMDPIFSAGVYLAMYSGKLAATTILDSLADENDGARRLRAYEKEIFRAMRYYGEMVDGFYTTSFLELLMEPRPKYNLPDAITAVLAGELSGGWSVSWRRKFFFLLTRIQAIWPLVPRISFKPTPEHESAGSVRD